jgi:hypothetical protein
MHLAKGNAYLTRPRGGGTLLAITKQNTGAFFREVVSDSRYFLLCPEGHGWERGSHKRKAWRDG